MTEATFNSEYLGQPMNVSYKRTLTEALIELVWENDMQKRRYLVHTITHILENYKIL